MMKLQYQFGAIFAMLEGSMTESWSTGQKVYRLVVDEERLQAWEIAFGFLMTALIVTLMALGTPH